MLALSASVDDTKILYLCYNYNKSNFKIPTYSETSEKRTVGSNIKLSYSVPY